MDPLIEKAHQILNEATESNIGVVLIIASEDGTYNIHSLYTKNENATVMQAIIIDVAQELIADNPMWGAGNDNPEEWLHGTPGLNRIH